MSESRIAKRYAKPLLELAEKKKSADIVKSDMEQFLAICQGNTAFLNMLNSPIIPHLKKGEILVKIFQDNFSKISLQIKHFFNANCFTFKLNFFPKLLLGLLDKSFEISLPMQ